MENYIYIAIIIIILLAIPILFKKKKKQKLTPKEKGQLGEKKIKKQLDMIKGYKKIISNVYLPTKDNKKTEVDIILVGETGIFFIESKNYDGWIFGNEKDYNWTQMLNKNTKVPFYNPIKQNRNHIKAFLNMSLGINEDMVYSIITFGDNAELKNILFENKNTYVVKTKDVLSKVSSIGENNVKLSKDKIDNIYTTLKPLTNVSEETKKKHIGDINAIKEQKLKHTTRQ